MLYWIFCFLSHIIKMISFYHCFRRECHTDTYMATYTILGFRHCERLVPTGIAQRRIIFTFFRRYHCYTLYIDTRMPLLLITLKNNSNHANDYSLGTATHSRGEHHFSKRLWMMIKKSTSKLLIISRFHYYITPSYYICRTRHIAKMIWLLTYLCFTRYYATYISITLDDDFTLLRFGRRVIFPHGTFVLEAPTTVMFASARFIREGLPWVIGQSAPHMEEAAFQRHDIRWGWWCFASISRIDWWYNLIRRYYLFSYFPDEA